MEPCGDAQRQLDLRFRHLEKMVKEKERRLEEKVDLMWGRLDERYETQKKMLDDARMVVDARLSEMNNLRFQIEGERKMYVTKGEFTIAGIVTMAVGVVIVLFKWVVQ